MREGRKKIKIRKKSYKGRYIFSLNKLLTKK